MAGIFGSKWQVGNTDTIDAVDWGVPDTVQDLDYRDCCRLSHWYLAMTCWPTPRLGNCRFAAKLGSPPSCPGPGSCVAVTRLSWLYVDKPPGPPPNWHWSRCTHVTTVINYLMVLGHVKLGPVAGVLYSRQCMISSGNWPVLRSL